MGARSIPDLHIKSFSPKCRVHAIGGITMFGECLTPPIQNCKHGLRFGDSYFCYHPELVEMIAHTRRQTKTVAGK